MHKIFVTEGVVLSKRGAGEANTSVSILTNELGLVRASARSARKEISKLRYGLEPLTRARFSLVRGKHEWRLVGAERVSREFVVCGAEGRQAFGRISRLLLRLIAGEEPVPALYKTILEGFEVLSAEASEAIEIVLVLRILAHLGYLPKSQELAPFTESHLFSLELAAEAARSRSLLVRAINQSLEATGL